MRQSDRDVVRIDSKRSRRRFLAATGAVGTGLLAGCLGGSSDDGNGGGNGYENRGNQDDNGGNGGDSSGDGSGNGADGADVTPDESADGWRGTTLEPVRSGQPFTIASFDRPVVIQSFAVWCPKCQRQSETIAGLDDSVVRVGLNTDPNEDDEKVRNHAEQNGFDWRFAVAPTEMTESLREEFGPTVVNAPSTPVIVACQDGSSTFMSGSQQSVTEITDAADQC